MMKRFLYMTIFCVSVWQQAGAQNVNWEAVYPSLQSSWFTYGFYDDTAANLLYVAGNGISTYDGNGLTPVGTNYCPGQVHKMIMYHDTLYLGSLCAGRGLMRWNGSDWDTARIATDGIVLALHVYNDELYVGGIFTTIGGIPSESLAKYDGTTWTDLSGFPLSYNYGVASIMDYNSEIYVGGNFGDTAGNVCNIARWDGAQWHSVGGGFHGGMDDVRDLEVWNNKLFIGGTFSTYDGNVGTGVVQWDGTTMADVGGGVYSNNWSSPQVNDMVVYNNELWTCGIVAIAGGVPARRIAKWDGMHWCGLGDTINYSPSALGTYNSELFMAGGFNIIYGSDTISGLAKWIGGNYVDTCGNTTAIHENAIYENTLSVFPNPGDGNTTVKLTLSETTDVSLSIYSITGTLLHEETRPRQSGNFSTQLDFSTYPKGLYFLLVKTDHSLVSKKIMIQR